jgi:hypothetical protein
MTARQPFARPAVLGGLVDHRNLFMGEATLAA